ncbi:MAG: phage tail tape measure protein, partial [Sphaerochaetaceae bacterium]|nr:phage tail tape measure protein [Sphaerochaetaceae bacterium]
MAIQPIRIVIQGIDQFSSTIAQSQKKIENFGKGLSQVGKKMSVGLTLPIVAFGASTIKTAADFEKAMNRVQVLTRASEDQFNSLRKQAKDLGRTTVFSAVQ